MYKIGISKKNITNKQSGFSLIELAIVVVVVALLTVAILKSKTIIASFKCLGGSSQYSSNISLKDRADKLTQVMDGNLADAESEINNLNNSKGSFKSCVDKELNLTNTDTPTTPSDLPVTGSLLWLDASDASTIFSDTACTTPATGDGTTVKCWKNKSGNQGNFISNSTNTIEIMNSKNSINFSGSSFDGSISSAPAVATIFIVGKKQVNANKVMPFWFSTNLNIFYENNCYGFNSFDSRCYGFNNAQSLIESNFVTTHVYVNNNSSDTRVKIKHNGTLKPFETGINDHKATSQSINIGGPNSFYWRGLISEVIVYNELTDSEISQVECYLGSKWSIGVSGC